MQIQQNPSDAQNIPTYDELNISQVKTLHTTFDTDEIIYFSGRLKKFDAEGHTKDRILIITNKAVYNIHPKDSFSAKIIYKILPRVAIKKKITGQSIRAVNISTNSDEFIIQVKNGYDYRFLADGNREKIIKALATVYFQFNKKLFRMYLSDDSSLKNNHTTQKDFKAGVSKRPSDGKIEVSLEMLGPCLDPLELKKKPSSKENLESNDTAIINTQPQSAFDVKISQHRYYEGFERVDSQKYFTHIDRTETVYFQRDVTQDFQQPQPHSSQEIKEESEEAADSLPDNTKERVVEINDNPFNRNRTIKKLGDIPETISVVIPRNQVERNNNNWAIL